MDSFGFGFDLGVAGSDTSGQGASLPIGAIGAYYASDYDAATRSIPNALSSEALSQSLNRAPRRLFNVGSTPIFYAGSGITWTNDVTGPDAETDWTRLQGTGNWFASVSPGQGATDDLPAGTYTVAVTAVRNGAVDQVFAFSSDNTATRSAVKTATATEQQFTYTFTRASLGRLNTILLCSSDGSTAADLKIRDFVIYEGSSAPAEPALSGHLYLGTSIYDTRPVAGTGYIDMSAAAAMGVIQFADASASNAWTVVAVHAKVSAGSSHDATVSKAQAYTDLTAYNELANRPAFQIGGSTALTQAAGLWEPLNKGYFAVTRRHTGTVNSVWVNDGKLVQKTQNASSVSVRDLWFGLVNDAALPSKYRVAAFAIWPTALSDADVRSAVEYLTAQATAGGVTVETERIFVFEGDSISSIDSPLSYAYKFGANASPWGFGAVYAVSGSTIADLETRATTIDAILPPAGDLASKTYILHVLCTNSITAGDYLTRLQAYCQARTAAGWTVVVGTITPRSDGAHNTARNSHNPTIRGWVAAGYVAAIADYAADATMGPDAAGSDVGLYSDGVHPTATGHTNLEAILRPVLNGL